MSGVLTDDGLHLFARPLAPRRVVQAIIANQHLLRAALFRPVRDKLVPVANLGIELQAKTFVDDILDVIWEMIFEKWFWIRAAINHCRIDSHFAQPAEK